MFCQCLNLSSGWARNKSNCSSPAVLPLHTQPRELCRVPETQAFYFAEVSSMAPGKQWKSHAPLIPLTLEVKAHFFRSGFETESQQYKDDHSNFGYKCARISRSDFVMGKSEDSPCNNQAKRKRAIPKTLAGWFSENSFIFIKSHLPLCHRRSLPLANGCSRRGCGWIRGHRGGRRCHGGRSRCRRFRSEWWRGRCRTRHAGAHSARR